MIRSCFLLYKYKRPQQYSKRRTHPPRPGSGPPLDVSPHAFPPNLLPFFSGPPVFPLSLFLAPGPGPSLVGFVLLFTPLPSPAGLSFCCRSRASLAPLRLCGVPALSPAAPPAPSSSPRLSRSSLFFAPLPPLFGPDCRAS